EFETGATDDQPVEEDSQHPHWLQKQAKPPTPNRIRVDTLTPELLASPTYELMKGSCKSLVELEFFLKEVYKATTDQLDWNNLKGQQYSHDLLKLLPLIPNSRGHRVIPFVHFIKNESVYVVVPQAESIQLQLQRPRLRIQDIKDMMLLLVQGKLTNLTFDERFAFNVSLRMFTRSIVIQRHVEDLQLGVKSYQKKLNLTKPVTYRSDLKHKEAYTAYSNPRGIIYQNKDKHNRHVEDLQLGVKSYQKKLNLTKPVTYRSDLKHKEAYTAYSNPRGIIYQNKDKHNRVMRIDELHKFSDGTPNDVRTALDDRLKGIRMQYLPQTISR
nr:hypothetical protein [Tanacetum cinerariifolium]